MFTLNKTLLMDTIIIIYYSALSTASRIRDCRCLSVCPSAARLSRLPCLALIQERKALKSQEMTCHKHQSLRLKIKGQLKTQVSSYSAWLHEESYKVANTGD